MTNPQAAVYIVGVGMTPTGNFLDRDIKQLTAAAVNAALADEGVAIVVAIVVSTVLALAATALTVRALLPKDER